MLARRLTFARVDFIQSGRSPRLLNEPGTARLTLFTARVMLTTTNQLEWVVRVGHVADGRMTVAHASATDGYVLDTVVVLEK